MACLAERLSHRERILARIRGASTVKSLENQSLKEQEKVSTESPGKSEIDSPKPESKVEKPGRKFEKPVIKIEKPVRKIEKPENKVVKPTVPQRKAVSKEANVGRSITIEARKQSQRERILQRIRNQQPVVSTTTSAPTTKPITELVTEQATEPVTLSGNRLPIDEIEIESSRERVKPLYERPSRTTQGEEVPRITAKISKATTTTTRAITKTTRATTTTTKATTLQAKPTRFSRSTTVKAAVTQNARNTPTSVTASSKLETTTQNAKDSPSSTTTSKPVVTSTASSTTTIKHKPRYLSLPNTNKCQNRKYYFGYQIIIIKIYF